jgi:hypothetical protein
MGALWNGAEGWGNHRWWRYGSKAIIHS